MTELKEPKKALSAYFLWLNAEGREEAQKQLGGVKDLGKVAKVAGEKWKTLPANIKEKYEKQNVELKAQYEKDLAAFKEAGGVKGAAAKEKRDVKASKEAKKAKKEDEKDKPKRPAGGAFGVWLNAKRSEIMATLPKGTDVTGVTKAASAKWKAMSEADKKPWEEEYKKKAAQYEKDVAAWKASRGDDKEEPQHDSPSPKAKVVARKRPDSEATAATPATPPAKKAKGRGKGAQAAKAASDSPVIDASVLQKAVGMGLDSGLKNLAGRQEMKDISHDKMLSALQASGGLVNKAKASLLGA